MGAGPVMIRSIGSSSIQQISDHAGFFRMTGLWPSFPE
jgi:hypothetical protein